MSPGSFLQSLPQLPYELLQLLTSSAQKATTVKTSQPPPSFSLGTLRKLLSGFDPNCAHDEWRNIGMALHYESSGSQEGLLLWDEWSKKATRSGSDGDPVYKGPEHLARRWSSFTTEKDMRLITGAYLVAGSRASASDFSDEAHSQQRVVISLDGGELHQYALQSERILSSDIYVRERQLVRIGITEDVTMQRDVGIKRDKLQAVLIPATTEYIRRRLNEYAIFRRYRHREKSYVQVDCPKDLALNIAGQGDWSAFRPLVAIARAPFVRPDGSICETKGYDAASRVFYQPNSDYPLVPDAPTREDALSALNILLAPFHDFPFATEAARSAFVAHLLTEIVRPAVNATPAFLYTAPSPGTGKTLLSEMPSRIVHGCGPALRPWVDGEELRKSLFSSLLAGDRTIAFDNLPNGIKVRSPVMCGFLTAETYGDRKLGASEAPAVPNRAVVFCTGNNITPAGDLARRSLVIRLDANTTKLSDRRFAIPDLRSHIACNRETLLIAALTVVKSYVSAGMTDEPLPLPSFEQWSYFVRQPLVWLGQADPVSTQDDEADDEILPLAEAFKLMVEHTAIGNAEFTASELASICDMTLSPDNSLTAAIEAAGCSLPSDPVRVGYWLREKRDRIAGGLKLVRGGEARGAGRKWRLKSLP